MIWIIVLLLLFGILGLYLWNELDIYIDNTKDQIILWYDPIDGGHRTFKILYTKK